MKFIIHVRVALLVVAASYLTLAVLATDEAKRYWWEYAVIVLILSIANLASEWRRNGAPHRLSLARPHR